MDEKDINTCHDKRVRLDEKVIQQQKEIDLGREERMELYDYKNDMNNRLTTLENGKVDHKTFNTLSKCVTTLKAEKKFLPYVGIIVSILTCVGTLVYVIIRIGGG